MKRAIAAVGLLAASCAPTEAPPAPVPATTPSTTAPTTTTTAPLPVTTHTHRVARARVAPVAAERAVVASGDVWAALAACESGNTNLHGPRYFGFHSWLLSTWRAAGGTGRPDEHTYAEQVAVAERWLARTSWGQWPACSKRLGLR